MKKNIRKIKTKYSQFRNQKVYKNKFISYSVIILVLLYLFRNFIQTTIKSLGFKFRVDETVQANIKKYKIGPLTINDRNNAEQIYSMMNESHSDQSIVDYLNKLSPNQLAGLYDSFGKREDFALGNKHDLFSWFQDEISDYWDWENEEGEDSDISFLEKIRLIYSKTSIPLTF